MFFPTLPFLPWSANKLAATAIFAGKGAKLRGFASQDEVAVLHQINTWVADSDFLDRWAFPASFRKPDFPGLGRIYGNVLIRLPYLAVPPFLYIALRQ
jgi:hypothetical protein